jgi:general secretion pathway protein F
MQHLLKVYRQDVGIVERKLEAPTVSDAIRRIQAEGFHVLSSSSDLSARPALRGRGKFPLLLFVNEMVALMRAGLNVIEAVDTLATREHRSLVADVLMQIRDHLSEGHTLSRAMENLLPHFPEMLIATVRASERTGSLNEALERYLAYRQQLDGARAKIIGALLYPALIIAVGAIVLLFLLIVVVPRFSDVYEQLGDRLPPGTALLISWGRLVHEHGELLLIGSLSALVILIAWLSRAATRAAFSKLFWRVPVMGERLRLFQLARFFRTVGMLQTNGITLVESIGMARTLLVQPALAHGIAAAEASIREGHPVAMTLAQNGLTDEVAFRLLRVGERNGEMGRMLLNIADFYDTELAKWLDWATRLFEPLLMAIVGTVIGAVVLLMYLPIFQLADSLQ